MTTRAPDRVMVCVSSNTRADRVIEAGARIAARLRASWYAVYVDTPLERRTKSREQTVQSHMRLAEARGAIVVRVNAMSPADGLIAFAQREGVTHAIFGQSARSRWERLRRGSVIARFVAAVADAVVNVVP